MKKRIFFFIFCLSIFFILITQSLFCQDSLTNKKYNFYIHAGINNSIPKEKYYHYYENMNNNVIYNYSAFPQYSILGGNLSFGFQYPFIRVKKLIISVGPDIGIDFYHHKIIKFGTFITGGIISNEFKGGIYETNNDGCISLNILSSLLYSLNNNTNIIFYGGGGIYANFFSSVKHTEDDIIQNEMTNFNYTDISINNRNFYYVSTYFKIEICKLVNKRVYGIFVGTTFLGEYRYSDKSYNFNEMNNSFYELAHRYFILNYGLTYKF